MRSRDVAGISDGDLYFLFDNCVHFNQNQALKCFVTETGEPCEAKEIKKIYLSMDEDSLRSRKGVVRQGFFSF